MNRKQLNIGLFGFGCVGYGLYQVLEKTPTLNATIKKICVKDKTKPRPISADHFTFDKNEILGDDSINVVVELIDDADRAFEIVSAALKSRKAVVSANKKMIAEHLEELIDLQDQYQVPLLYEASCCASIPILRNLEEYYDNELLDSVEGIVNGSTNYILTKMFQEGQNYADALAQAQAQGYAESDPSLDTGGFDAKYKLLIIAAHAFGGVLEPQQIFNAGIDRVGALEQLYAKEKGLKIKLIAQAFKKPDGSVIAFVSPKFIKPTDKLYQVDDVYNGVTLKTVFSEDQFFVGKGAGAYPTASAVISDLSALTYDYKYEYKKIRQSHHVHFSNEVLLRVFVSFTNDVKEQTIAYLEGTEELFSNAHSNYAIGTITLDNYILLYEQNIASVILLDTLVDAESGFITHDELSALVEA